MLWTHESHTRKITKNKKKINKNYTNTTTHTETMTCARPTCQLNRNKIVRDLKKKSHIIICTENARGGDRLIHVRCGAHKLLRLTNNKRALRRTTNARTVAAPHVLDGGNLLAERTNANAPRRCATRRAARGKHRMYCWLVLLLLLQGRASNTRLYNGAWCRRQPKMRTRLWLAGYATTSVIGCVCDASDACVCLCRPPPCWIRSETETEIARARVWKTESIVIF